MARAPAWHRSRARWGDAPPQKQHVRHPYLGGRTFSWQRNAPTMGARRATACPERVALGQRLPHQQSLVLFATVFLLRKAQCGVSAKLAAASPRRNQQGCTRALEARWPSAENARDQRGKCTSVAPQQSALSHCLPQIQIGCTSFWEESVGWPNETKPARAEWQAHHRKRNTERAAMIVPHQNTRRSALFIWGGAACCAKVARSARHARLRGAAAKYAGELPLF